MTEERKKRVHLALATRDEEYLNEYTLGRKAAEENEDRDEVPHSQAWLDGYDITAENMKSEDSASSEDGEPDVSVGFHPLGGIALNVRDDEGKTTTVRLSPNQAWCLIGTLNVHTTMLINAAYMQATAEAQAAQTSPLNSSRMDIPRGRKR